MIFSNIKQFFKQNKKIFYYIGFFIVIFALSSDSTFAETAVATKDTTNELISKVAISAEFLLKGISVLLALITFLATMFLSPEWINGSLFGLNTYFKDIWILVSNVVYFAFAFILIWVAFMNIIGKNTDQYQLKQALPKFIVGVIIVPFSWFLIQFILSLSAILTVSALTLPFDTFNEFETGLSKVTIPQKCTLDLSQIGTGTGAESFIKCPPEKTLTLDQAMNGGSAIESIYGIISMYTYGVLSFDTIGDVDKNDFSMIKTLGDLVVKIVFDLLFVVVYSILIITLGIVLMIRGIYIWVYTMISPVFGLMYFFGKKDGGGDGFFGKFNVKEFIALAMVPVYTMLALSFGLLFIYVVGMGLTSSSVGQGEVKVKDENDESSINIGQFSLVIKGAVAKPENVTGLLGKIGGGGLGVVGSLILKVFGIVILWGTVMAAMRSSEITKQITQPLHDFGAQVGKIAASAPGNIPIFGGQSMKSMSIVASGVDSKISQINSDRGNKFLDKTPFGNNTLTKSMGDLQNETIRATSDPEKATLMKKILKNADGDFKNLFTNPSAQKALFDLVNIIKPKILEDLNIKKPSDINNGPLVAKIYEKVEDVGLPYKKILPEDSGKIDEAAIIRAVKVLKNETISTPTNSGTENNPVKLDIQGLDAKLEKGLNDIEIKNIAVQLSNQSLNGQFTLSEFKGKLKGKGITDDGNINKIIDGINLEIKTINDTKKAGETKVEFFKQDEPKQK